MVIAAPGPGGDVGSLTHMIRDGGLLVLLGTGDRCLASALALAGGLMSIEQARAGRTVITSGLVKHFD